MKNLVIADGLRLRGDVLQPAKHGIVASLAQRIKYVVTIVVERKAAMCEAEHSILVSALACQQAGTAGRARWGSAECGTEQNTFTRQLLNIRCRDCVTVRGNIAAGIVGMDVKNVGRLRCGRCRCADSAEEGGGACQHVAPRRGRFRKILLLHYARSFSQWHKIDDVDRFTRQFTIANMGQLFTKRWYPGLIACVTTFVQIPPKLQMLFLRRRVRHSVAIGFFLFMAGAALTLSGAQAPAPAKLDQVLGTVTAVKSGDKTFTVKEDKTGTEFTVSGENARRFLQVPPGEKDLKKAKAIDASQIKVGDRLLARGHKDPSADKLDAMIVIVMTAGAL